MSEIAQVVFGGVSNALSEHAHEQDELSMSINAVNHDGSIRSIHKPVEKFKFDKGMKLVAIHTYDHNTNYILMCSDKRTLRYISDEDIEDGVTYGESNTIRIWETDADITQVTYIRLVLVISTKAGIRYARYNGNEYKYLGAVPRLPYIYPAIETYCRNAESFGINVTLSPTVSESGENLNIYSLIEDGKEPYEFENDDPIQAFLAKKTFEIVNQVRSRIHSHGHFFAPFFVRFALKMYDGTYTCVSKPFPLIPTTSMKPVLQGYLQSGPEKVGVSGIFSESDLKVYLDKMDQDWDGIISGIDIFVSKEIVDFTDSNKSIRGIARKTSDGKLVYNDNPLYQTLKDAEITNVGNAHKNTIFENVIENVSDGSGIAKLSKAWYPKEREMMSVSTIRGYGGTASNSYVKNVRYAYLVKNDDYDAGATFIKGWGVSYEPINENESEFYGDIYKMLRDSIGDDSLSSYKVFYFGKKFDDSTSAGTFSGEGAEVLAYRLEFVSSTESLVPYFTIDYTREDGKSPYEVFAQTSNFYKIDSIDLKELENPITWTPNEDRFNMDTIETMPTLKEDSVRPYDYSLLDAYVYNNRLNVVVDKQRLEESDYLESYSSGIFNSSESNSLVQGAYIEVIRDGVKMYKTVRKYGSEGVDFKSIRYAFYPDINATALYIYNEKFEKITDLAKDGYYQLVDKPIRKADGTTINVTSRKFKCRCAERKTSRISLEKHETLYGAFAFNSFNELEYESIGTSWGFEYELPKPEDVTIDFTFDGTPDETAYNNARYDVNGFMQAASRWIEERGGTFDTTPGPHYITVFDDKKSEEILNDIASSPEEFHVGNKILQSEVDNPFVFMNSLATKIGCDKIYKITSSALPISQGQFGQYPLYAFTDTGIWALSVASNGTYSSVACISNDVCTNPKSVTQLDQSVLFVTKRGLMQIAGGQVECVSRILDEHNFTDTLSKLSDVISLSQVGGNVQVPGHIEDWMQDAMIVRDYKGQKVFVFKEGDPLCYVLSVNSGKWGMMYNDGLIYPVPTFTSAYAVDTHLGCSRLVDLESGSADESERIKSLIVTRPLTLDATDYYKTIESITLRGVFDTNPRNLFQAMKLVVWASNDMMNWYVIGSSGTYRWRNYSGTPYKAYRIGVLADWSEHDAITGATIEYTVRGNNKVR